MKVSGNFLDLRVPQERSEDDQGFGQQQGPSMPDEVPQKAHEEHASRQKSTHRCTIFGDGSTYHPSGHLQGFEPSKSGIVFGDSIWGWVNTSKVTIFGEDEVG
jgi:hypothetical protein